MKGATLKCGGDVTWSEIKVLLNTLLNSPADEISHTK